MRAPEFPAAFGYLFDWYYEFLSWAPSNRAPTWPDWLAWATLMQHPVAPADLRMLRRIYDAHLAPSREQSSGVSRGD